MKTLDSILNRRSIRKYKTNPVSDDKVSLLIKAGMYAPSARNKQPWHFIIVTDRVLLNKVMDFHPYALMLAEAPLAIVVCGDRTIEPSDSYLAINCSAATENILLAAPELDLGTVWLGVYPRIERMKGVSELFGLSSDILPVSIVAVGYPDEQVEHPERFLNERIHFNVW